MTKKLFVQTYGCQMASLLHAPGGFDAEIERVCGEVRVCSLPVFRSKLVGRGEGKR